MERAGHQGPDCPSTDAQRVLVPDRRIRAVFPLAPMAVVLTAESLAAMWPPHLPRTQASSTVAGAGHFAFMAQPSMPLPSSSVCTSLARAKRTAA